ncbi:polysaccharide deacetylase family protein [uncultured Paenibacillus sp.]|uniref:polysaccharide deacetylase family protein n=1 Tax=uncultured Paenibacillus sp. TaxID=227322 RepID=UPI0028D7283D|nr:polysaccharide deacetylase family protein [uncultured Paenibacillus sp.]
MNRYLILNCDDFGQSPAANRAIMHLLEERRVSSATIMPPAPAFEEAAAWVRGRADPRVGLHLTLTSELPGHRWSSLTGHPSLHDETGGMHLTVADFEKLADPKAVRAEINAQFDQVKDAGLPITHVDNHMGSLYGIETGRSYLPYVFWQCGRRGLPFRIFRHIHPRDTFLNSIAGAKEALAKAVALADTLGVAMPDYLLTHPYHIVEGETYDSFKSSIIAKIYELPEGVSETYIHPAVEDDHMQTIIPSWDKRVWEYKLVLDDDFAYALKDAGVQLVDYRYVRDNLKRSRLKAAWSLFRRL